jgi:hypothetical protein
VVWLDLQGTPVAGIVQDGLAVEGEQPWRSRSAARAFPCSTLPEQRL